MQMPDEKRTCCFTGHRAGKLPWCHDEDDPRCMELKRRLDGTLLQLYEDGVRRYICGMALGSDMYFAEAVLALRARRRGVILEAAIPCLGQDEYWDAHSRARYERLLAECDECTVISHRYTYDCMERRNQYMVEKSGTVVAVFSGGRGGTFNTIRYALQLGRRVIELDV